MTELEALIALNQLPKLGPITIRTLIQELGSATEVIRSNFEDIQKIPKCNTRACARIQEWQSLTSACQEVELCEEHGITVIPFTHPNFPAPLKDLKDCPILLYVKGTLEEQDQEGIAIVGSRKTTHYGRTVTKTFSETLAKQKTTILSGLALGIDTIAHETALSNHSRTIAVLGSGLFSIYPTQNSELAERISEQGAVVSEYPLMTHPDRQTFPQRNRIVAAWSRATLVTEMPRRSGAMITANYAKSLRRPIFAIPGPIDRPSSEGCHLLIQEGATLATSAEQILKSIRPQPETQLTLDLESHSPLPSSPTSLTSNEAEVYRHLSSIEQTIEDLHNATNLSISTLVTLLLSLEMQDLARQHPGMTYTSA